MSKETNTETAPNPTPEQVEANRITALNYYKKQTEVLVAQAEYEKLLADIEQSRAKRMEMIIRQAQMQAGPEPEDPEDTTEEKKKERPLKKS